MEGAAEVGSRSSSAGHTPSTLLQPTRVGARRLIRASGVDLDVGAMRVTVDGVTLDLPYKEFQLLRLLMERAGNLVPKQLIMDQVWRPGHPDSNRTLEVHVLRLRRRLRPRPDSPSRLRTVRGHGYIFDILDDDEE